MNVIEKDMLKTERRERWIRSITSRMDRAEFLALVAKLNALQEKASDAIERAFVRMGRAAVIENLAGGDLNLARPGGIWLYRMIENLRKSWVDRNSPSFSVWGTRPPPRVLPGVTASLHG